MRTIRGLAALTLAVATAAGCAVGLAVPALAAPAPAPGVFLLAPSVFLLGPRAAHAGCAVALFSARVSARAPAAVFASVDSTGPGRLCTAYVERSVTGKTAWSVVSARAALPSLRGLQGIANTGLVDDGPGYRARGCVRAGGSTTVTCTSAVSLARGAGTATSPALAASYERRGAEVFRGRGGGAVPGACLAGLASGTRTARKRAGATVVGVVTSTIDPCTAWIQSTANGGKTWRTVSPIVSVPGPRYPGAAAAFTARYPDGPGRLARICTRDLTSGKRNCSGSW